VADRTADVMLRLTEFVSTLSPAQLKALADGASVPTLTDPARKPGFDFVQTLTPGQLRSLADGSRALAVINPNEKPVKAPRPGKVVPVVDPAQIEADLKAIDDVTAATGYLKDLKIGKDAVLALAKQLDVPVSPSFTGPKVIAAIVDQKVKWRLASKAIEGTSQVK
jgi:hypothetical protein